eukprot:gene23290-31618_t
MRFIDAIVFIAMGSMAAEPMVDFSIASVRKIGKWTEEIFVITDKPACFTGNSPAEGNLRVTIIPVPSAKSVIEIKALKPIVLELLPVHVKGVLYMDVDILVTRNLNVFLKDLHEYVGRRISFPNHNHSNRAERPGSLRSNSVQNRSAFHMDRSLIPHVDFGAFLDAKGHYVGFCSGCEKWHTGVMWMQRQGAGVECMQRWREILLSGKFSTDQQSLDEAEALGYCSNALSFPTKHLLFGKDYIGMALTSGQTFIHVTAAGRPEDTDYFYREIVIPHLRSSLHPPLNAAALKQPKKNCLVTTPS